MSDFKQTDIKGYRNLTVEEVELINKVKEKGKELAQLIELAKYSEADPVWLNIADIDLKKGMMMLTRSIAKPGGF